MIKSEIDNVKVLNFLLALKKNSVENRANTVQMKEFYAGLNSEQQKAIDKIHFELQAKVISEVEAEFRVEMVLTPSQHDKFKELLDWHNRLVEQSRELRRQAQSYYLQPIEIFN